MARPRLPVDDPRLARRRAQYRNAQARRKGKPTESVPDAPDLRGGHHWPPPAQRAVRHRDTVVRHVVTGQWVAVTLAEGAR